MYKHSGLPLNKGKKTPPAPPPPPKKKKKRRRQKESINLTACSCIIRFLYREITHVSLYTTADSVSIVLIYQKYTVHSRVFGYITEEDGRLFCYIVTHFRGCYGIGDLLTRRARNFIYSFNACIVWLINDS